MSECGKVGKADGDWWTIVEFTDHNSVWLHATAIIEHNKSKERQMILINDRYWPLCCRVCGLRLWPGDAIVQQKDNHIRHHYCKETE